MSSKTILVPLPSYGFDPTEAAIPWKALTENGHKIVFASPDGRKPGADSIMLTGKGLGLWKPVLQARKDAVEAYSGMAQCEAFCKPLRYAEISEHNFDALLLPGGHDKGVKEYLESAVLQRTVVNFFNADRVVAAICHGVVLVARSIDPITKRSVLYNYKTTALLASQELTAFNMTRLWLNDYYLTYPGITVEQEVKEALTNHSNFLKGPTPMQRDDLKHLNRGFIVKDRNYLSARWPGDAYRFSLEFVVMLG